ncbi:MAG TPA: zf-HC2 domain-containing protein [Acidobacteriaceae bacterium]|nr:zf-HC2 domain-containing protein [Acidobacteriaceae bacterium]
MSEHLSPAILNAVVDGELEGAELARANEHLAGCLQCSSQCLSFGVLKNRVAKAQRYQPSPEFQARIRRTAAGVRSAQLSWYSYGAVAAAALVCAALFVWSATGRRQAQTTAVVNEVADQHIATLAANAPPEVISSDRHTVKPWFQGKLPFSFNLPQNLPADTTLDGANLTYLHGRPAAQLLYSIGKHHVSVFLQQTADAPSGSAPNADHAGFHVMSFRASGLEAIAVSDADPARVKELLQQLQAAQ